MSSNRSNLTAAKRPMQALSDGAGDLVEQIRSLAEGRNGDVAACEVLDELREIMWRDVGPFRTESGLRRAVERLRAIKAMLPELAIAPGRRANATVADWFELRAGVIGLRGKQGHAERRDAAPGVEWVRDLVVDQFIGQEDLGFERRLRPETGVAPADELMVVDDMLKLIG